jgi:hypothetical protein
MAAQAAINGSRASQRQRPDQHIRHPVPIERYFNRSTHMAKDAERDFEDHCWKDVIPKAMLDIYSHYKREIYVGPRPALLAIDLYELVYQGGPKAVEEVTKEFPSACGIHGYTAIPPTQKVFAAARKAGLPIIYTTSDARAPRPSRYGARCPAAHDATIPTVHQVSSPTPTTGRTPRRRCRGVGTVGCPLAGATTSRLWWSTSGTRATSTPLWTAWRAARARA